jgi:hypothetical protein
MPQLRQADGVCHQDQHASPNRLPLRTQKGAVPTQQQQQPQKKDSE